ncbi:MAG: patatin-like phospholipase family protein [Polyangiaceae bacterium]|nr:patatin-like phospholipase family protein [Polyangiaceae bacterium]
MSERRDLVLTLAGGGNRAFYQLGLLSRWAETVWPRLAAVASVSAGACVLVVHLSGRHEPTNRFWRERRRHVTKNFVWSNLLRGDSPAPHAPIYRDTILHALAEGGFERVRAAPMPLWVLTAGLPRRLPPSLAVSLGLGAYSLEKSLRPTMLHPSFGRGLGFVPRVFDARDCASPEELADLVMASSATPPFTPVGSFRGEALLDGGLIDNVPASIAERAPGARRNLVLLTRPYPPGAAGRRGDRLYLAPHAPLPIDRWDYTRPELLDATIAIGERDAETHRREIEALLSFAGPRGARSDGARET